MKTLAIVGTKRKNGRISRLCEKILDGAAENGCETELINLYDYRLEYCTGCWACVHAGRCVLKDDFERVFDKVKQADVIILGSPCYWGNVSGIMKNFFDRHTGFAMNKPSDAASFYKLTFYEKLRSMLKQLKSFGPYPELRGKGFILVAAMTIPFPASYLSGDRPGVVRAMKTHVHNMRGKLLGKVIYTDTLFRLRKGKEEKMLRKAYKAGKKLK